MRLSGLNQDRYFAAADAYERITRGEYINKKLLSRVIPQDADFKKVFDIAKDSFCLEQAAQRAMAVGVNYCMLRVTLDVFAESGLLAIDPVSGGIELIKRSEKADLSKSAFLASLKELL